MRIHLGHHFYGAGNLGDDFMLAGFLAALRALSPDATFTCCVPFALQPLQQRFPSVTWLPYEENARTRAIAECDVWLGLGGSPFQSALSRWFVDHLVAEARFCEQGRKPMFFLGIGVQTADELAVPEVRGLCARAAGIWTRDAISAERIAALNSPPPVEAATDLAHLFFRDFPPPRAARGRLTLVPNFDYGVWPGLASCLAAIDRIKPSDRVWLAQESRDLPGAERALYTTLPTTEQLRWRLVSPEKAGAPLHAVLADWPSGEWLLTARYHAALAGAWAHSKIIVLSTNEKLRAVARELKVPLLSPSADEATVARTFESFTAPSLLRSALAERAYEACAAFVRRSFCHAKS